jgi:hypothetical protein
METRTINISLESNPDDYSTRPTKKILDEEFNAFREKGEGYLSAYHFFKDSDSLELLDERINATARGSVLDKKHVGEVHNDLEILKVQQDAVEVAFSSNPIIIKHNHFFGAIFRLGKKAYCVLNREEDIEVLKVDACLDNVPALKERPKKSLKRQHAPNSIVGMFSGLKKLSGIVGDVTEENVEDVVKHLRNAKQRFPMTDKEIKEKLLETQRKTTFGAKGFQQHDQNSLSRLVAEELEREIFPIPIAKDKPVSFTDKKAKKPRFAVPKCDHGGLGDEKRKKRKKETIFRHAELNNLATRMSQYCADMHKNPYADVIMIVTNNKSVDAENWVENNLEGCVTALSIFEDFNNNTRIHGSKPFSSVLFAPHANASAMALYDMPGETCLKTPERARKDLNTYRETVKQQNKVIVLSRGEPEHRTLLTKKEVKASAR